MQKFKHQRDFGLRLSAIAFVVEIAIFLALPALFLAGRIPSFAIGKGSLWVLRWRNDTSGSGIEFNLAFLLAIAVVFGLIGLWIKASSKRRSDKV
ncbi:MAG: hypothetical protein MUE44_08640 [Oscillatoriaceae cyanobacterium Prado104]|nr:hypothetical protein [Oscillatoriaceae cyanobacterium Prado104]